jgi:SPP1 gp7 family putative phage head morphogenesis protein
MFKKISLFLQSLFGVGVVDKQTFIDFETENKAITPETFDAKQDIKKGLTDLPDTSIRSSVDNNANLINGLHNVILPEYGLDWLPVLNALSISHHDFSKAVQNVLDLANTPYEITFEGVSEMQRKKMSKYLEAQRKIVFSKFGEATFINTSLRQIAVFGALSCELVVSKDLRYVKEVVFVPNVEIRYVYENGSYAPYQQVRTTMITKQNMYGYQKLNTYTYKYLPIVNQDNIPYGIPPFLSALESAGIERDMIKNFASLMKRLGMFGFLEVSIHPPDKLEGESDIEYIQRLGDVAKTQGSGIANNLNDGYIVGFDGMQSFKMNGNDTNGKGQSELLSIIDTRVITGLKQDPNMLGRHTTVTETFGKVLLTLLINQTETYQMIVAGFLEHLYINILKLGGFEVDNLKVEFSKPNVTDELKDEQTKTAKISNLTTLYEQGIITQTQMANELGYNQPAQPAPITKTQSLSVAKKKSQNLSFDYSLPTDYETVSFIDWGGDTKAQAFASNYTKSIDVAYNIAIQKTTNKIESGLTKGITQKAFISLVESAFSNWENYFKIDKPTKKYTKDAYMWYRSDKGVFEKKTQAQSQSHAFDVPNVVLDLSDKRAMEFLAKLDSFYLGKFITDEDTKKRVLDFLNTFYLENGEAIGDNKEMIKKFKETFASTLQLESWKIRRIIDTSVNRLRAWGNLNYMSQAQENSYQIVEVLDRITCPHCRAMNARVFSVKTAKSQITSTIKNGVDSNLPPFITTLPIADVESAKSSDLESKGFLMPPFHPHCRGRLVVN